MGGREETGSHQAEGGDSAEEWENQGTGKEWEEKHDWQRKGWEPRETNQGDIREDEGNDSW